jgi:hypothetical protein
VVALVATTFGVATAAGADATVADASLCETIQEGDVGAPAPPQSSSTTAADAKKSLKLYKRFAKSDAPPAVKKALATIVSTLKKLAAGTAPAEIWGSDVKASSYGKAAAKVNAYVVKKCVNDVIEDLPGDVEIPDIGK